MDDLKNPISSISFKGFMRATVIKRDDDKLEGRVGVNIHKLMPDEDHTNLNEKESIETPKQQTNFFSSESEVKPIENEQIVSKNFYWARPSFRFSNNKGKTSGNYLVPQIGELVVVYFEDNDPQKCRYLPFDIVKDREKLLELEKTFKKENLEDPIKKPNIEILTKTPNNNIIGFDYNENTNQYIVRFDNNNYFIIESNQDVNKIELNTTTGRTKITMDDKIPKITIKCDKDIEINATDSIVSSTKVTTINSSDKTTVNSKTDIVGDTKIDGVTNITSNLFTGGSLVSNGLFVSGPGVLNGLAIATVAGSGGGFSIPSGNDTSSAGATPGSVIDLSLYVLKNPDIVSETKTKITYDAKGLVIKGEDITTSDILEVDGKKYVTNEMYDYLLTRINGGGNNTGGGNNGGGGNNTGGGNITPSFYISTTQLLTNNMIITHNINFFIRVEFFTDTNGWVMANYEVVDSNSIRLKLEEDFIGYVMVYKLG
jgi:hypothetical protein